MGFKFQYISNKTLLSDTKMFQASTVNATLQASLPLAKCFPSRTGSTPTFETNVLCLFSKVQRVKCLLVI